MEGGIGIAMALIGVIGIILIFTILKINENLTQINEKLTKTNECLEAIKKGSE